LAARGCLSPPPREVAGAYAPAAATILAHANRCRSATVPPH
jgi:hypothetical protein